MGKWREKAAGGQEKNKDLQKKMCRSNTDVCIHSNRPLVPADHAPRFQVPVVTNMFAVCADTSAQTSGTGNAALRGTREENSSCWRERVVTKTVCLTSSCRDRDGNVASGVLYACELLFIEQCALTNAECVLRARVCTFAHAGVHSA